jgi:hypothetical protein
MGLKCSFAIYTEKGKYGNGYIFAGEGSKNGGKPSLRIKAKLAPLCE